MHHVALDLALVFLKHVGGALDKDTVVYRVRISQKLRQRLAAPHTLFIFTGFHQGNGLKSLACAHLLCEKHSVVLIKDRVRCPHSVDLLGIKPAP